MRSMRWNARGFTLIELMIVVAIIRVLGSIALATSLFSAPGDGVPVTAPGALPSAEAPEVGREGVALALSQGDSHSELLEILLERLAAEVDLAGGEKCVDVPLELRGGEPDHG